jgi:hypothetical protein
MARRASGPNTKRVVIVFLFGAAIGGAGSVRTETQSMFIPGLPVEFVFRALQPGEVILARMKEPAPARRMTIRYASRTYELIPSGGDGPGVLLGLDVGLKPEPLPVEITEEKADGSVERYQESLAVEPKEFSRRRFRVDEKMLTAPPSEQERVKREQDLLQAVYGIVTPAWQGTGAFIPPLAQEAYQNFGQQRIYNRTITSVHAGVDIAAPYGTLVRASNSGTVVLASDLYFSGRTVILDHGRGVFSQYYHCSKLLVKRGDTVRKGAFIARVGNTGRSTGPHLHWGIRIFDSRVDPFSLLALPLD